jgi:diguanylate cyclase (GGDEF)-like protein
VWAGIHGGFVLAASVAHIVAWRTNENQLLRDPLTGLPSRLLYINNLKVALQRLLRSPGRAVAVLFLDLDRFKVINDSLGHGAGDELLKAVAERIGHNLRRHETLARFGGDEFVILCEDIFDDQDAVAVAERVLKSFTTPFHLSHGESTATASIGIAVGLDPDQEPEDLIRDADAAMYRAKAAGGSCSTSSPASVRWPGYTPSRRSARRSSARSSACSSSPRCRSAATGSSVSRPSCAGSTPSAASSVPPSSSASPRRPG